MQARSHRVPKVIGPGTQRIWPWAKTVASDMFVLCIPRADGLVTPILGAKSWFFDEHQFKLDLDIRICRTSSTENAETLHEAVAMAAIA